MVDQSAAIRIVEGHLAANADQDRSYVIAGIKKQERCWAIGVQPYKNGQAACDIMGFEVDLLSGELSQWS